MMMNLKELLRRKIFEAEIPRGDFSDITNGTKIAFSASYETGVEAHILDAC